MNANKEFFLGEFDLVFVKEIWTALKDPIPIETQKWSFAHCLANYLLLSREVAKDYYSKKSKKKKKVSPKAPLFKDNDQNVKFILKDTCKAYLSDVQSQQLFGFKSPSDENQLNSIVDECCKRLNKAGLLKKLCEEKNKFSLILHNHLIDAYKKEKSEIEKRNNIKKFFDDKEDIFYINNYRIEQSKEIESGTINPQKKVRYGNDPEENRLAYQIDCQLLQAYCNKIKDPTLDLLLYKHFFELKWSDISTIIGIDQKALRDLVSYHKKKIMGKYDTILLYYINNMIHNVLSSNKDPNTYIIECGKKILELKTHSEIQSEKS